MKKFFLSFFWVINHPNNKNKLLSTCVRLLRWKFNQLFLGIPAVVKIEKGIKFKCYPDSSWGGLVVYTRLPEYYEMKFVKNIINKADVVIDVGANLGSYSLIAASRIVSGRVFAFEPSKVAYKRLLENIKLNDFEDKIIAFNLAVSHKEGNLNFTDTPKPEISHVSYNFSRRNSKIKSITLDKFARRQKLKKIRLIKIDVEGYEYRVLRGASEILKKGIVDYLLIEVNKDSLFYKIDPSETIDYLRDCGYETYFFRNSSRLTPITKFSDDKKTVNIIAVNKNIQI